jgi:hypothetical protein
MPVTALPPLTFRRFPGVGSTTGTSGEGLRASMVGEGDLSSSETTVAFFGFFGRLGVSSSSSEKRGLRRFEPPSGAGDFGEGLGSGEGFGDPSGTLPVLYEDVSKKQMRGAGKGTYNDLGHLHR